MLELEAQFLELESTNEQALERTVPYLSFYF